MEYAVITGVSKGLGSSVAKQMIEKGIHIVGVSRSENEELRQYAETHRKSYVHFSCDLSSERELESVFSNIIDHLHIEEAEKVYVVNNAGVIEPIDQVGALAADEVINHIQVNLIAPMLITNMFYREMDSKEVMIVNITSGAAERAVHGWSTYGSAKAGLNYFTETAALEQEQTNRKHKIVAFSPGIMDTDMQEEIRSSTLEAFAEVEKFKEFKEKGMLRDTDVVAQALLKLVFETSFESGKVYHVNDLLD